MEWISRVSNDVLRLRESIDQSDVEFSLLFRRIAVHRGRIKKGVGKSRIGVVGHRSKVLREGMGVNFFLHNSSNKVRASHRNVFCNLCD